MLGNCDLRNLQSSCDSSCILHFEILKKMLCSDLLILISLCGFFWFFNYWAGTVFALTHWMARPTLIVGFPLAQYDPSFIVLAIIIIRTKLGCNLLNVFIDVLQLKLESQLIYILINVSSRMTKVKL